MPLGGIVVLLLACLLAFRPYILLFQAREPPGQAGIDRERSHELRDGLLVWGTPRMSSGAQLTDELWTFECYF